MAINIGKQMAIEFTPDNTGAGFNLTKINNNFQKVDTAFQDALSRSGTGPNQMEADIDLNSNDLLNVRDIDANTLTLNGELIIPGDPNRATFATPLGGGNQAPVPRSIVDRSREYASTEDFGISLYEKDGVTVKDNTAALQDAIDKLQPTNGILYVPNYGSRYGATTIETGPLTLRDSGSLGGRPYEGSGISFIGQTSGERTSWANGRFDLGQGFKLKAGSTGALLTSPAKAGHINIENMMLVSDFANAKGIDLQDRLDGEYGYGAFICQTYIKGFLREGLNIGANRGRGATDWMWIELCGTAGSHSAMVQGSYDWEHIGIGLGVNAGPALYLGAISQVRFIGGAIWMSEYGAQISSDCDNVDFIGVHFDTHQKDGVTIAPYTGSSFRRGTRRFIGCRWSDNSDSAANTYSDIRLFSGVNDTYFSAPAFEGKSEAAPKQKYCVEAEGSSIFFVDAFPHDSGSKKPYTTAFINDWTKIRMGGYDAVTMGLANNGASGVIYAAGVPVAEFRDTGVSIGDTHGLAPLRAEKISGGTHNRVLVQSTDSGFSWPLITVESGHTNANLVLSGKGTGKVGVGNKVAAADAASDGYIEVYDSSTGSNIKLMTRA